jgi:DNA-directed RNA polymerase subunit RPC12/RpoP
MELTDQFKRIVSVDIRCARCSRPMAIQRFTYAGLSDEFSSIDYKCLSCGYEEVRPYSAENV